MKFLVFYFVLFTSTASSQEPKNPKKAPCEETQQSVLFQNLFPKSYSTRDIPPGNISYGVDVRVNFGLVNLLDINQIDSTIRMHILFMQNWADSRLASPCHRDRMFLRSEDREKLWNPNIKFVSAIDSSIPEAPVKDQETRVEHDGQVSLSDSMIVRLSCHQNFKRFPFDKMLCRFQVRATGGSVNIVWDSLSLKTFKSMTLATHKFSGFEVEESIEVIGMSHIVRYKGLIKLQRYATFYYFQVYIPNTLTVMMAWLSFSISPTAVPARVTLGISSMIAMVLQYGNVVDAVPKVGYLKGIDIWMVGCIFFIFSSMAEFAYISYLKSIAIQPNDKEIEWTVIKIDSRSRILYLILFALFFIAYFLVTLMSQDEF